MKVKIETVCLFDRRQLAYENMNEKDIKSMNYYKDGDDDLVVVHYKND